MAVQDASILKIHDVLLVTLPPDPDDATVCSLQERVLHGLERPGAGALLLDLSVVECVDSFFARMVTETAAMVSLMGGRTLLAGMRPAVAITAIQLGLSMKRIETALDVEQAMGRLLEGPWRRS